MSEETEGRVIVLYYNNTSDREKLKDVLSENGLNYKHWPLNRTIEIFPGHGDPKWFLYDIRERFNIDFTFAGDAKRQR